MWLLNALFMAKMKWPIAMYVVCSYIVAMYIKMAENRGCIELQKIINLKRE